MTKQLEVKQISERDNSVTYSAAGKHLCITSQHLKMVMLLKLSLSGMNIMQTL